MDVKTTYIWWKFLCITAAINIIVWLSAIWMRSDMQDLSYWHPVLSGIYVSICAFRSFYPRIDLERYCLYDHPLSSVAIGRSFATIAEVCFSIQIALLIHDLGILLGSPAIINISYAIVPIIVLAQISCWYATLTLNHIWHAVEEAAWVVMIMLAAGCLYAGYMELTGVYKLLMAIGLLSCLGSAYIMLFIDIPMYLKRTREGERTGVRYLSVNQGIRDAVNRRIQTHDWTVWKKEAMWITPYFTFGVWLSIGMMLVNFST
jgi:hypothetical protein